ncbi:MAG TPA: RnfH family protein [Candidatus Acidoferrales bacterium]|nr:RnfH family protein [Candidatus Acidoferrales bacterium]
MQVGDDGRGSIAVTVVHAGPERVWRVVVELPVGACVMDAVRASGLAELLGEAYLSAMPVGVFGEVCTPETALRAGDRVEIYRPLPVDPKQARRQRAERARAAVKS